MKKITVKVEKENYSMPARRFMLWLSMAGSGLIFGALIVAHAILTMAPKWKAFDQIPLVFWVSAGLIMASSYTMHRAKVLAQNDELDELKTFIALTLVMGVMFSVFQVLGWFEMISAYKQTGIRNAVAFIYILSGLHMLHALGGLGYLAYTTHQAYQLNVHKKSMQLIEDCGTYWHFLDIVWVVVVAFLWIFN